MSNDTYVWLVFLFVCFWVVVLTQWANLVNKMFDMFYQKKPRPKKTQSKCPVKGTYLKDFEVFEGHCVSCTEKEKCSLLIAKNRKS